MEDSPAAEQQDRTMQASQIELVPFLPEHLDGALALSRQAGWPHRREDWAMVLSLSNGVVALEDGRVAGTTFVTAYGDKAATINMVIVDEALRGRGIGRRLMNFGLERSEGRECRLIATQEGLPLYTKLGFRETGVILQYQGVLNSTPAARDVEWAGPSDLPAFAAIDRCACGLDRHALIERLADQGQIAVLRRDGRIAGFGAVRAFGRGELAGPVVASSLEDAKALLSFLLAARPGAFMRVDTHDTSGLAPFLGDLGLAHVGGGIAMRRGGPAAAAPSDVQTYALASQALG